MQKVVQILYIIYSFPQTFKPKGRGNVRSNVSKGKYREDFFIDRANFFCNAGIPEALNNSKLQPQTRYTRIVTCPSHCRLHPPVSIAWSWFVGVLGSARLATPHCTSIGRCPGKAGERQEKKIGQFREIVKRGFYEEGR